jgi:peptide-methionine (S)-S-oxide reductase
MQNRLSHATLGGGCFWCIEAALRDLVGVSAVVSGYAGGHVPAPTYEQVCTKTSGHAEVVQVTFDPAQLSYADLLRMFFTLHDPTTPDRQGNDVGPQYRSTIMTHDGEQQRTAHAIIAELTSAGLFAAPIVTVVEPLTQFWPAEPYHQRYFERNPEQAYCAYVVAPKVAKFRRAFADRLVRSAPG